MPELRRNPDGVTELPPAVLDCGHEPRPGRVIVGYHAHPDPEQGRMRELNVLPLAGACPTIH